MDNEVKKKVDEYQDYLLSLYGFKQADPEAGTLLKAQLDVNAGKEPNLKKQEGNSVGWSNEFDAPDLDYRHSPETLLFALTLTIPTDLKNGESGRPDLPICGGRYEDWDIGRNLLFPPEFVKGMIEELDVLNTTVGLTGPEGFTLWGEIYQQVLEHFISWREELRRLQNMHVRKNQTCRGEWERVENREETEDWDEAAEIAESVDPEYAAILREYNTLKKARDIPRKMRGLTPEGVQVGSLFMLTAMAFLAENRKPILVSGLRDSRAKARADTEDVERAEQLLNEIRWLMSLADDEGNADEHHLFSSGLGAWLKQVLPDGFTDKMKARIEELVKTRADFHEFYHSWISPITPDKQAPERAKSPGALEAFEATVEILSMCTSQRRAPGIARELFGLLGIIVTAEAMKKVRQRTKK
jgi:hypothetical protein